MGDSPSKKFCLIYFKDDIIETLADYALAKPIDGETLTDKSIVIKKTDEAIAYFAYKLIIFYAYMNYEEKLFMGPVTLQDFGLVSNSTSPFKFSPLLLNLNYTEAILNSKKKPQNLLPDFVTHLSQEEKRIVRLNLQLHF